MKELGIDIKNAPPGRSLDALVADAVSRHTWVGAVAALRNGEMPSEPQVRALVRRGVRIDSEGYVVVGTESGSQRFFDGPTAAQYLLTAEIVGRAKTPKRGIFGDKTTSREREIAAHEALDSVMSLRVSYERLSETAIESLSWRERRERKDEIREWKQEIKRTNKGLKDEVGLPVPEGVTFDEMVSAMAEQVVPTEPAGDQLDRFLDPDERVNWRAGTRGDPWSVDPPSSWGPPGSADFPGRDGAPGAFDQGIFDQDWGDPTDDGYDGYPGE